MYESIYRVYYIYMVIRKRMQMVNYREHIEIILGKRSGKPCVKGTRITVVDVLGWLANDMSIEDVIEDFPELVKADIQACLAYAADRESRIRVIAA